MRKLLVAVVAAFVAGPLASFADNIVVRVVDDKGAPVEKAQVVAILKSSGGYQDAKLDKQDGNYKCQTASECVKIYVGAPGFEAVSKKYSGSAGTTSIAMKSSPDKSSAVIHRAGSLPGIEGTVNPHLDSKGKTYLHTDKIGIEQGGRPAQQPVAFSLNRPIDVASSTGQKFKIWVVDIMPEVSLLEFTTPK